MDVVVSPAVFAAVIGSVLNITLVKVDRCLSENSDFQNIRKALGYINAAIKDHQIGEQDGNLLREWIDELRALAHEIEDCTDRCMSRLLPMDTEEAAGRLRRAARYVANAVKMHRPVLGFAMKLGKLKKKSAEVWTRLQEIKNAPGSTRGPAQQSSPAADLFFACMKDAEDRLVSLVEIPLKTMKLKVITIVGFGGQGTTSLARQFYDSTQSSTEEARRFIHRIWVHAAGMNAPQVHDKIISQLPASSTTNNLETRKERLRACLKGRYLIVIEDVDIRELSGIISGFHWDDGKGSRIIVTKNFESEARLCVCRRSPLVVDNTAQFLKIGELTEIGVKDDCKGFGEESCKVLGSNYQNIRRYFPDEFKAYESDDLAAGYVPPELLLYFCMFPCDHPVSRDLLIKRWLAEGIISTTSVQCAASDICRSSQDVAFDALVKSNIIQPIQISKNGRVKRCHSPAMMLDHISRLPELKKFITLCCRDTPDGNCFDRLYRLSLHGNAELPKDLSRLRTMAVFYTGSSSIASFAKYELLRVLDLKEFAELKNKHVKKEICNLVLLKYLSLGDTIDKVPKEIAKLKQLETLDLSRTKLVLVPVEVIKLKSLTHLLGKFHLRVISKEEKIVKFLSKHSKLERLSGFVLTNDGNGFVQMMPHMVSLKKVKVWHSCTADTASLNHLNEGIKKFIGGGSSKLPDDRRISIELQECSTKCSPECSRVLMDSLTAQGRLTSLKLRGKLTQFPEFSKLNIIEELCLSYTNVSWDNIVASLNELHTLRNLKLVEENLENIKIESKDLESLRRICLVGVRSLHGINICQGALEYLESLHILCKDTDEHLYPGIDIARHEELEEVALHHGVQQTIKVLWQRYAYHHTRRPKVLFIESGPDPPTEPHTIVATTTGVTIPAAITNRATEREASVDEATLTTSVVPKATTPNGISAFNIVQGPTSN